ncbi:MAG: methionyl-tRNA formyltransferase [Bacteroidales bacterium]|nr:methionyl-tRNA formyltransferase [Bacteroidales bacterium]
MMENNFRIVFMGTPDFAVPSLRTLYENGYEIPCVVTAPDKPAGRGRSMKQPPVKIFAASLGLKVVQPQNLKDEVFVDYIASLSPNLIVVVAFRMLPEKVWRIPECGTVNLHASLLPQYRGAAPINWVIINGETETGLTTFFIDREIDTGRILLSEMILIAPEDNAGSLHDRMMLKGADLLLDTVRKIERKDYTTLDQKDTGQLKKAPKLTRDDCLIRWDRPSKEIIQRIRGLSPYPGAFTVFLSESGREVILKIYEAMVWQHEDLTSPPGRILLVNKGNMLVSCADGWVKLLRVQMEGKKALPVIDFLAGFRDVETWRISGDTGGDPRKRIDIRRSY